MDIGKLKERKPWFVPEWLWNRLVNAACDATLENARIATVASFVGDAAMDGLQKAIEGKDADAVALVCTMVANGGQVFVRAAEAAKDGVITDAEKADVGGALKTAITVLVPQETVNAKIEEVRSALLFG